MQSILFCYNNIWPNYFIFFKRYTIESIVKYTIELRSIIFRKKLKASGMRKTSPKVEKLISFIKIKFYNIDYRTVRAALVYRNNFNEIKIGRMNKNMINLFYFTEMRGVKLQCSNTGICVTALVRTRNSKYNAVFLLIFK